MSSLSDALTQQISSLSQLKELLDSELHLISTREAEALLKLVEEKEQVLAEIEKQDQLIATTFDSASPQDESTKALQNQLKEILEECKYRTEINARAVEQGQLRLEHLRKLILEVRNKESMTYDKSGRAQSGLPGSGVKA